MNITQKTLKVRIDPQILNDPETSYADPTNCFLTQAIREQLEVEPPFVTKVHCGPFQATIFGKRFKIDQKSSEFLAVWEDKRNPKKPRKRALVVTLTRTYKRPY